MCVCYLLQTELQVLCDRERGAPQLARAPMGLEPQTIQLQQGPIRTHESYLKVPAVETLLRVLPQRQKKLGQNQDLELKDKDLDQVQAHTGSPGLRWR